MCGVARRRSAPPWTNYRPSLRWLFLRKRSVSLRRCRDEVLLMLGVSRSGYYDWCVRAPSARTTANLALLHDVRRLQARHQGRYGSPRMHAALRAEGHRCSRGRVERLMRRPRIRALAGRRFRPCTTDSRHYLPIAPNLLAQNFVATAPNRIWLADITYIATGEGWLYLAAVLDLATRKIVGWAIDRKSTRLNSSH